MKISNIEEVVKVLNFYFSPDFQNLKKSEQKQVKEEFAKSISKIDGVIPKLREEALNELFKVNSSGKCYGNLDKVIFILQNISEEDRAVVVKKYLESCGLRCSLKNEILLPMLDNVSDETKVKLLSKVSCTDLLTLMSDLRTLKHLDDLLDFKEMKYRKKYYQIFKLALDEQNKLEEEKQQDEN